MMLVSILTGLLMFALIVRYIFRQTITMKEFGLGAAILIVIIASGFAIASFSQTSDVEILSGKVTDKKKVRVSCRHSYQCNCYTTCSGGGKNYSCTEHCSTCYEHSYDNDWDVLTTIGTITIDTLDRQGLREPPRWSSVMVNEPASTTHGYTNWLKAAPDSVFRRTTEEKLPDYPKKIYDYYRIDRVVLDGVKISEDQLKAINYRISESLRDLAKAKQVNLVVVLTSRSSMFSQELRAGWLNGKKNDMIVVIGTKQFPEIEWVDAFGWSANELANVKIRDDIREHGVIDASVIDIAIKDIAQYWSRKPMQEYEYLKEEIELSDSAIIILILIGLTAIGIGTYIFNKENIL